MRYPEGVTGNGWPVISIRDGGGQLISQYIREPGESNPILTKDFVRGASNVLVEREVSELPPAVASATAFYSNGEFGFEVIDGQSGDTYTVDIRTESGYTMQLTGVSLDAYDTFQISENYFEQGETNYVRIRSEGQDAAVYSAPVTLILDPNVTPESENQINKMSVSRVGTDVIIRWALLSPNGSTTNLYYDRQDGGGTEELALDLAAAVRSYTVEEQSLATECITIAGTQDDGQGESLPSAWTAIPSSVAQDFSVIPPCDQPPPPSIDPYNFADYYHHRDHLGNLRVVTDAAGAMVSAHDYYPFGMEITPDSSPEVPGGSRMRFTGHERDELTDLDYMLARYYGASVGRFLSVDPAGDTDNELPLSWNGYSYVRNNPVRNTDPTGLAVLINDMSNEELTFIQAPEIPSAKDMTVPAKTDVSSKSKPGAQDGFVTYDVKQLKGASPEKSYGPSGAYIDTGDARGRDIHGGGSSLANPTAPKQPITKTLGCTRGHNADVLSVGNAITDFKSKTGGAKILFLRVGTPTGATKQSQTIPSDSPFVKAILSGQLQVEVLP